jgi:hypothetical protein
MILKCDLTCRDLELFSLDCIPVINVSVIESGGLGLESGSYQFAGQLSDQDNNTTNIFGLTRKKSLGSLNNKPGEISEGYFQLSIDGIKSSFTKINLFVIKRIGGVTTASKIGTFPYSDNGLVHNFRSYVIDEKSNIPLEKLTITQSRYLRGKDLIQKNGRLLLYNIQPEFNVDYQKYANNIKVKPVVYRVPIQDAYKHPSMLRGEVYALSIRLNYEDGTHSADFHIPGRDATEEERARVEKGALGNCSLCDKAVWEIEDTSSPSWTHPDYNDPYVESDGSVKEYDYTPKEDPKYDPNKEAKEYEDKAKEDVDEVKDDFNNTIDVLDSTDTPECACIPDAEGNEIEEEVPCDFCTFCPRGFCIDGICKAPGECMNCPCDNTPSDGGDGDTEDSYPPNQCLKTCGSYNLGVNHYCPPGCICDKPLFGGQGICRTLCVGCDSCPDGECKDGICKAPSNPYCNGCECSSSGNKDVKISKSTSEITSNKEAVSDVSISDLSEQELSFLKGSSIYYAVKASSGCSGSGCGSPSGGGTATCGGGGCGGSGGCTSGGCGGGTGIGSGTAAAMKITQGNVADSLIDEEPIYDASGCNIVGYKPVKLQEWSTAFWESEETYPLTRNCEGNYIYGELAGKRIKHHKMPGTEKCPHFISYQTGVPNLKEAANLETEKGYAHVLGLKICDIPMIEKGDLPKPLCKKNPYTIRYVKRDLANRSIVAKGMIIDTFKAELYGEAYYVQKNGVNSLELFDRYIERNDDTDQDHSGEKCEFPGYTFFSPDTMFSKVPLFARKLKVELEIWGKGFRHGMYAWGKELPGILTRMNQKGTRAAVHLNKYVTPKRDPRENQVVRCLRETSYLPANGVLQKGTKFSLPWLNLHRESAVAMEFDGDQPKLKLNKSIDPYLIPQSINPEVGHYNGTKGGDVEADNTCDASFLGDGFSHEGPIHLASAWYGSIINENPSQYGRLELQQYIDLGLFVTEAQALCGTAEGICGDTWISQYSVVRKSYISNKVGESVLKSFDPNWDTLQGIDGNTTGSGKKGGSWAKKALKWIVKIISKLGIFKTALSIIHCGEPPASKDNLDPRNGCLTYDGTNQCTGDAVNGSFLRTNLPDGWDGKQSFIGQPVDNVHIRKGYYPGVQKTMITFFVESDVNVNFRQTDQENLGEIAYPRLKSYNTDSYQTQNTNYEKSFLNRFYCELKEVDFQKKILIFILTLIVKLILPIYIIVQIAAYLKGAGSFAFIFAVIVQFLMFLAAIVGCIIIYAILNYILDKYMVVFLQLRQCRNDSQGGPGDSFIVNFEDNYCKYNSDHSSVSDLSVGFGMGDPYNTCKCEDEVTSEILVSNPQVFSSTIDAYRNFKILSYTEIPSHHGKISKIFIQGSNLYVQTTDMLWNTHVGMAKLELDTDSVLLGRPDFINQVNELYGGIPEGFAGSLDPNSSIGTFNGQVILDREARRIYLMDSKGLDILSFAGLDLFLQNNLYFNLLEQFPKFKVVDEKSPIGIGYNCAFDNKLKRFLITKKDYKAIDPSKLELVDNKYFKDKVTQNIILFNDTRYFEETSFTLSYDLGSKTWISYHSYLPDVYLVDRFNLFSVENNNIYLHNNSKTYQRFYGKYYPIYCKGKLKNRFY